MTTRAVSPTRFAAMITLFTTLAITRSLPSTGMSGKSLRQPLNVCTYMHHGFQGIQELVTHIILL